MRIKYTVTGPLSKDQLPALAACIKQTAKHHNVVAILPAESKHRDRVERYGGRIYDSEGPHRIHFAIVTRESVYHETYKGSNKHTLIVCLERSSYENDMRNVLKAMYGQGYTH